LIFCIIIQLVVQQAHRDAQYVPAGIGAALEGTLVDEDYIVLTPQAPIVNIYQKFSGCKYFRRWDQGSSL
jgi:hypothetical protein